LQRWQEPGGNGDGRKCEGIERVPVPTFFSVASSKRGNYVEVKVEVLAIYCVYELFKKALPKR
jgi:hypothetical protein